MMNITQSISGILILLIKALTVIYYFDNNISFIYIQFYSYFAK